MAIRWIQDGEPHVAEVYNRPLRDFVAEVAEDRVPSTRTISVSNGITGGGMLTQNLRIDGVDATRTTKGVTRFATTAEAIAGELPNVAIDPHVLAEVIAEALSQSGSPGMVSAFARSTPPSGWLRADGSAVSRAQYADLYAVIGTTFGTGDGISTFNLPDLRGEFVRGWDDGRGIDTNRQFGSYQKGSLAAEDPSVTACRTVSLYNVTNDDGVDFWDRAGYDKITDSYPGMVLNTSPANIDPTSATEMAVTRPRNVSLLYCIKS